MRHRRFACLGLLLPAMSLGLWHNFGSVDTLDNARAMIRAALAGTISDASLTADPVLRQRYQIWSFMYGSGNPLVRSIAELRAALTAEGVVLEQIKGQCETPKVDALGNVLAIRKGTGKKRLRVMVAPQRAPE